MSRGLLFLLWRSAWGRMVRAVRRLREPRYLVGFIVGGGAMLCGLPRACCRSGRGASLQVVCPPARRQATAGPSGGAVQLAICAVRMIILGIWWLGPFGKHALEFSEAELHLLLPAPLPRRHIFEYAILRSQVGILVGCTIVTIFSGARDPLTILPRFAGVWILFTIWDLHSKGRALWLAGLAERTTAAAWSRRIGVAVAILAAWALLAVGEVSWPLPVAH